MLKTRTLQIFIFLTFALLLGGCQQPTPALEQPSIPATPQKTVTNVTPPAAVINTISIKDFKFSPENLTIPADTAVTWNNQDTAPHSIISEGLIDSGIIDTGKSFSFTFKEKGSFEFHCGIHPSMKGIITVN